MDFSDFSYASPKLPELVSLRIVHGTLGMALVDFPNVNMWNFLCPKLWRLMLPIGNFLRIDVDWTQTRR
jgi:hypothetical protein